MGNARYAVFLCLPMKYLCSILLSLLSFSLLAQLQRNYSSYTVDNGLAQNSVWDMIQDYKGYMWFGTVDGANRLDGYKMKHYKFRKDDTTSILGNNIYRFYEDSSKNLWISHDKGISIYNRSKDNFINKPLVNNERYSALLGEDNNGRVWCITGNQELVGYHQSDFSEYKRIFATNSTFSISSIRCNITANGKYIIGLLNDSLTTWFKFNTQTEEISIIHGPPRFTGAFLLLNDSTLCCFAHNQKYLYHINSNTFTVEPTKGLPFAKNGEATAACIHWQNKIYFGNLTGLFVYNPVTNTVEEHITSFTTNQKIGFTYVQNLNVDRSGNLWICTNGNGVKCFSPYRNKFKHYSTYESKNTLVKAICADSKRGTIYTGLWGHDLVWYSPNGQSQEYHFKHPGNDISSVLAVTNFDDDRIMLVNQEDLIILNTQSKKIELKQRVSLRKGVPIGYPNFRPYKNGWVLSCDVGFYFISKNKEVTLLFNTSSLVPYSITTFSILSDSVWWVGFSNEFCTFNPYTHTLKQLAPIVNVKSVCFVNNKTEAWVGSGGGGLHRFYTTGKHIKQYDFADGLPDDFVYSILEDKYKRVWISHNKGMSVYFPHTKTFKHYGVKDGLQGNEFNTGAYCKDENGLLYFGGVNGVNVIDPDHIIENKNIPQISINEILLDDLPYEADTAYNEINTINVSYLQNTLSFDFSALEFSQPEDNIYRYKMEGYDNNWIESGTKHFARYANLPPGSYTLKIKAANGDGVWNETPREIYINVKPPYWQTGWFYTLVIIFILLTMAGAVYAFFRRQKARLKQELEVQQKLEEERLRISRDLHDNVGAQLSYLITNVEWMLQHPNRLNEKDEQHRLQDMSDAGRNAILTLRQTIWAISQTSLTIEDFADRFKQFALKMVAFNKQIHLQFKEDFGQNSTLSPAVALHLFRVCQEAFNNSLKHAQAKNILISFYSSETTTFSYTVSDDGIGFNWEEAKRKGHYGLVNMQARAHEANAGFAIESTIGKGTSITIALK